MSNAAHELADLFETWKVLKRNVSVRLSRGHDRDTIDLWRSQVRAAELLREVDRYLQAATASDRNVEHYLRGYVAWAKGVFAPDIRWNESSSTTTAVIDQPSIDLLRALGDMIDSTGLTVSMSPATVRSSTDALDDLLDGLLDPNVTLSQVERQYVFELISSVRRVMEESNVLGSVDLLRRVHELLGVMTMLAETLSQREETKSLGKRILSAARRVVPYVAIGSRVAAGTLGAASDLLQITDGI